MFTLRCRRSMFCCNLCGCHLFFCRCFCCQKPPEDEDDEDACSTPNQLAETRDVDFVQPLSEPLTIGSHILCTGTPNEEFPWFALNIGNGDVESGRADIAVHFNVRLPQSYVVRNTRRHGNWGLEETTSYRLFPFKLGQPFAIEVLVDENETFWAVDGVHYCNYKHRNPSPFTASWIQVTGIRDATLNIQSTTIYPTLSPKLSEVPQRSSIDNPPEGEEPTWNPNLIATIKNGVPEGHQLIVIGRLRPLLYSFSIDLMDEGREWPRPNVHVHVNVRAYVEPQREHQLVVLNTFFGEWGLERRQRTAKLIPGTRTVFRLIRGPAEWSIYADDVLIGELEYRASPNAVKAVRLRGDLSPTQIYICPSTSSPIEKS